MSTPSGAWKWIERLRTVISEITEEDRAVVARMGLAQLEWDYNRPDIARATLVDALPRFAVLHPGTWTSLAYRAGVLCDRLGESSRLAAELSRGLVWLGDPQIAPYQDGLLKSVRGLAVRLRRADALESLAAMEGPPVAVPWRRRVDQCHLAARSGEAGAFGRALADLRDACPAIDRDDAFGLVQSCVAGRLFAEGAELYGETDVHPTGAADLARALWEKERRGLYEAVRRVALERALAAFRTARDNHHFASADVRSWAEVCRRLGDAPGYADAESRFATEVQSWWPRSDWIACAVYCDLSVMNAGAGHAESARAMIGRARLVYDDGGPPELKTHRGSRSLMASILSAGYRGLGEADDAIRMAKRIPASEERRMCLITAYIAGGRDGEAEAEVARCGSAERRAISIEGALRQLLG